MNIKLYYLIYKNKILDSFRCNTKLLKQLYRIKREEKKNWIKPYYNNYFYQGWDKIGIKGVRNTDKRLKIYDIDKYLDKDSICLDIGCNTGFLCMALANKVKRFIGIEINLYLVRIAYHVRYFNKIENVKFITDNFMDRKLNVKYDAVFSLANHATVDGNMHMAFREYIDKIVNISNPNAYLFFETHSLDSIDYNIAEKVKIIEKYYGLLETKIVDEGPALIKRLFYVFRRKE